MPVDTTDPLLKVTRAAHPCFDDLVTAMAGMVATIKGNLVQGGVSTARESGGLISQVSFREPIEIHFDGNAVLTPIVRRAWPDEIELRFGPRSAPPLTLPTIDGMVRLLVSAYAHAFISYFENNVDTIRTKYPGGEVTWPTTWDFARVVRNALGHGGEVNITTARDGQTWRGLTYMRADNGRRVLYNDMSQADLTLLMLDMDEHL